jgi:hypothetical protein
VNKIGLQFGLVTTQSVAKWAQEKLPSRYERRTSIYTNKCKIIGAGGRPIRAAAAANFDKNSGARHFALEELQDKKKWYCGTMISPFAGPKTDAESNWGKSEISYSAQCQKLGCVAISITATEANFSSPKV